MDDDLVRIGSLGIELEVLCDRTFGAEPVPAFIGGAVASGGEETAGLFGYVSENRGEGEGDIPVVP